jgi:hypothetical protein
MSVGSLGEQESTRLMEELLFVRTRPPRSELTDLLFINHQSNGQGSIGYSSLRVTRLLLDEKRSVKLHACRRIEHGMQCEVLSA